MGDDSTKTPGDDGSELLRRLLSNIGGLSPETEQEIFAFFTEEGKINALGLGTYHPVSLWEKRH